MHKIVLALLFALSVGSARAADSTVAAMSAASALGGTELLYCVQGGGDTKCTAAQIKTFTSASPTLVTPVLGVASATSINKVALTAPATGSTLTIADGKTLTVSNSGTLAGGDAFVLAVAAGKTATISNTLTLTATDGSTLAIGAGGTLGTSAYITLGANVGTWMATPSSANLAAALTDETGTGGAVFADSPRFVDDITLGTESTTTGQIKLAHASSAFLTTIQAGNAAAARTYTWPTNFGAAGTVLTDAAGNGTLSWAAGGGGLTVGTTTVGSGTTLRLLYDNAGTLGETTVTYSAAGSLSLPGNITVDGEISSAGGGTLATLSGRVQFWAGGVLGWSDSGAPGGSLRTGLKQSGSGVTQFIHTSSVVPGSWAADATAPAQITSNQNDYNPGSPSYFQRWNTDASRNVTGLVFGLGMTDGQRHVIVNSGTADIVIKHNTTSTAANRFQNTTGADITLTAGQLAWIMYDATAGGNFPAWRVSKMN